MSETFQFNLKKVEGGARLGEITMPRGTIRTPAFMPVGTVGTVKAMYLDQVRDSGADIILGNTYHLMLRPGPERVARLGGLHRNTFLNSPKVLDPLLRLRADPRIRFAGQITGCEGYVESAAIGLIAGRMAATEAQGQIAQMPPPTTAIGALINHITGGHIETIDAGPPSFQPMNVNFGLFPPIEAAVKSPDGKRLRGPEKSQARKRLLTERAKRDMEAWLSEPVPA